MIDISIRCLLRDRRTAQGISQRDLEIISGIPRSRISKYETGKVEMTVETAVKFALILHCGLDDLFEYVRT